jgi:hypothetical protein
MNLPLHTCIAQIHFRLIVLVKPFSDMKNITKRTTKGLLS